MAPTHVRVLVVDDEPLQARPLCAGLRNSGIDVTEVTSLSDARSVLETYSFHLIVIDRQLRTPTGIEEGLDLCREIRAAGLSSRIVIFTNLASAAEHREGWAAGADDYIEKTWAAEVAIARCEAHLARISVEHTSGSVRQFAVDGLEPGRHLVVDERAAIVARAEDFDLVRGGGLRKPHLDYDEREHFKKAKMTDLDLAVFFHLYLHRNKWISEYDLLREVWAYSDLRLAELASNPDSNSGLVHTTIARIRRKIDTRLSGGQGQKSGFNDRGSWAYIATSNHEGQESVSYRFNAGDSEVTLEGVSPILKPS